tara:strand:+ start:5435 stop:5794 length:360 start_codon:yes stop_codon:yes gene_type:complete
MSLLNDNSWECVEHNNEMYTYLDKIIKDGPNTNRPRFVKGYYSNLTELKNGTGASDTEINMISLDLDIKIILKLILSWYRKLNKPFTQAKLVDDSLNYLLDRNYITEEDIIKKCVSLKN